MSRCNVPTFLTDSHPLPTPASPSNSAQSAITVGSGLASVRGGVISPTDSQPTSNPAPTVEEATSSLADVRRGAISPKPCGMHQFVWRLVKLILSHQPSGS